MSQVYEELYGEAMPALTRKEGHKPTMPPKSRVETVTERTSEILAFITANPGCHITKIITEAGANRNTVHDCINKLMRQGLVVRSKGKAGNNVRTDVYSAK